MHSEQTPTVTQHGRLFEYEVFVIRFFLKHKERQEHVHWPVYTFGDNTTIRTTLCASTGHCGSLYILCSMKEKRNTIKNKQLKKRENMSSQMKHTIFRVHHLRPHFIILLQHRVREGTRLTVLSYDCRNVEI